MINFRMNAKLILFIVLLGFGNIIHFHCFIERILYYCVN